MAHAKGRNRARDFDDLVESAPQELDPENDAQGSESDSADGSDDGPDTNEAREHYVNVGKGKFRRSDEVALGAQYKGSKISRGAMLDDDEDEDDPFSRGFDEEDSEEESDVEMQDEGESDSIGGSDTGTESTELSKDEDHPTLPAQSVDTSELRKIMAAEQKAVAASVFAANKADADKGRAVQRQRATFDSLLNMRIKLQKSLIATNSLAALSESELAECQPNAQTGLKRAEAAAFNLWSSLTAFRDDLSAARAGEKRKRQTFSAQSDVQALWRYQRGQEESTVPDRNAILQKWSVKARSVAAGTQRSKLNVDQPTTIVDVLNEQLSKPERLLKRARTPRSCAPVQLSKRVIEDDKIYDDADFYGLLLKELLEAKSSAGSVAAANVDLTNFANMRREAKTRKNVDTKASKGRKLRYTVHEKLQNFCAPDDRTTWGERQTHELFSSLFGQRLALAEDETDEDEDSDGDHVNVKDAELMLFRA